MGKKLLAFSFATAIVGASVGAAWADLVVKDGNSVSRTVFNFVCQTTKLCNATVLIKSDGTEIGTSTNPVRTDPTGGTAQPVSAVSWPLPTGAATQATLAALAAQFPAALGVGGGLKVDGSGTALPVSISGSIPVTGTFWQATQPVSAASWPLPTGAATETTLAAVSGKLPTALGAGGGIKVDGSGTAIAVSGTFWQATQPVSAASLPLPTGAATSANQTGGGQKTQVVDASGNVQPSGDAVARAIFQKVTDGTNTVAVKAASTAPAASDPAAVVSLSPNGKAGYEFDVANMPTVQAAAYSAGNNIGGKQSLSVFRSNGGSGVLNNISVWSKGGSIVPITLYIFNANPSSSTCTDKSAFSLNVADVAKLVAMSPPVLTPGIVGSGTTATSASQQMPVNVVNGDSTQILYVCAVVNASVTPASTTDLIFKVSGVAD